MNKAARAFPIVLVLAAAATGYYYWLQRREPPAQAPSAPVIVPLPAPAAAPVPEPQIRHPIEPAAQAAPLPSLDQSDGEMAAALRDLLGAKAMALLLTDRFIHRIVATVDALPRAQLPVTVRPLKPIPSVFLATGNGADLAEASANAARYAPYAALARSVDARALVDVYRRFYPLFQQAYRDIGYPQGYFNDRLIEAIDDLLDAPEPTPPVRLTQPKVLYLYADPELEARSAGQKIMIRMGRENEAAVKAKLRQIRPLLAGHPGPEQRR